MAIWFEALLKLIGIILVFAAGIGLPIYAGFIYGLPYFFFTIAIMTVVSWAGFWIFVYLNMMYHNIYNDILARKGLPRRKF